MIRLHILSSLNAISFRHFEDHACLRVFRISTENDLKSLLSSYPIIISYDLDPKIANYLKSLNPDIIDAKDVKISEFQYTGKIFDEILLVSSVKDAKDFKFNDFVFVLIQTYGDPNAC